MVVRSQVLRFRMHVHNTSTIYKGCRVHIGNHKFPTNLIYLKVNDFNVILGMDWLAGYHANMDCFNRVIDFKFGGVKNVQFEGEKAWSENSCDFDSQSESLIKE